MLERIPIGGLTILDEEQLNGPDQALAANDCYVDTDGIRGRNGYRSVLPNATTIGSGGDVPQGLWRHRVSPTSARFVVAYAGNLRTVSDPSSDAASDGTLHALADGVFGAGDNLSAAQLGDYLYIASDAAHQPWRRVKPDYSLESIIAYPPPTNIGHAFGSYSWSVYRTMVSGGHATTTTSNCSLSTSIGGLLSSWYAVIGPGGTGNPLSGATVLFTLTTPVNASGCDWMAVGVSPPSSGSGNKHVYISISHDNATYIQVGDIWDTPVVGGSPNMIWCSLATVPDTVKASIQYIRFEIVSINDGTDLRCALYGHMFVRSRTQANPIVYYVDFYNSTTKLASQLSPKVEVTVASGSIELPRYTDQFMDRNAYNSTQSQLEPLNPNTNKRLFTASAMPSRDGIGVQITLSGTTPALTGPDRIRLWKETPNGLRLVTSVAYPGASTLYSLVDNGSLGTLANEGYTSGGTPPRVNTLASRAQRLVGGYLNRVYISSFTSTNMYEAGGAKGTQPFPKFPDIAEYDGDGWSFDIAPGTDEIIQAIVNGDSLYILTNKAVYSMNDLTPNSPVYHVYQRGAVGRRAALWAEQALYWASWDGVYEARNRASVVEISAPIRRYWRDTFTAGSSTCLAYKDRKLYVFNDTKFLRFDYVKQRWTSGTLAHSVAIPATYSDAQDRLALFLSNRRLARWLDDATSDLMFGSTAGTLIPAWLYSSGFFWVGVATGIRSVVVDATAPVTVLAAKVTDDDVSRSVQFTPDGTGTEVRRPFPADITSLKWRFELRGANDTIVRRVMWEPTIDQYRKAT